jgi:hypothetical protein
MCYMYLTGSKHSMCVMEISVLKYLTVNVCWNLYKSNIHCTQYWQKFVWCMGGPRYADVSCKLFVLVSELCDCI